MRGVSQVVRMLGAVSLGLTLYLCGCSGSGGSAGVPYQGTANVGDFIAISIDHTARTISYENRSNGESGTVSYTLAEDGSYEITDPDGNLVTAFEIPGYALVLEATNTGPNADQASLVVAILTEPISKSSIAGKSFNFMQFRTASGGMEIGYAQLDPDGNVFAESYWPYGHASGSPDILSGGFSSDLMQESPDGNYLVLEEEGESAPTYIFATQAGFLALDMANGSMVCLEQRATKDFDPAWAGTYKSIVYHKQNATTDQNNQETGDVNIEKVSIAIGSDGSLTVSDSEGQEIVQSALTPIADDPNLVGEGRLQDPANGIFSFRIENGAAQQDVFVVFLDDALLLSSFAHDGTPFESGPGTYDYFYGVGLRL